MVVFPDLTRSIFEIYLPAVIPEGYTGLVIANERRAREWQRGLADAEIDVVRVATRGNDQERGSWQIAVADEHAIRAREFVSRVIRGEASLPALPYLSAMGMRSLVAIGVLIALLAFMFVAAC